MTFALFFPFEVDPGNVFILCLKGDDDGDETGNGGKRQKQEEGVGGGGIFDQRSHGRRRRLVGSERLQRALGEEDWQRQ